MKWSDDFNLALPFVENPYAEFENEDQMNDCIMTGKSLADELQQELGPSAEVELRIHGGGIDFDWKPSSQKQG